MLTQKKLIVYFFTTTMILVMGCTKDDNPTADIANIDKFYIGSLSSASVDDLSGIWAIFNAQFNGETVDVPVVYESCGRDFFIYSEDGTYQEYLYQSSSCEPKVNQLNWELNNGIISLSNSVGQKDDFVITKLNEQELVFKSKFDVDEDGELDVLLIFAKKYEPTEIDFISRSFKKNEDDAFENLISFTWDIYEGFNQFEKYEILRSSGEGCSKANAELIATITDVSIVEYTDLNPPSEERICYYFKIYTNDGLLGESNLYDIIPSLFTYPNPVNLEPPVISTNDITLNWQISEYPYFSHYELSISEANTTSAQSQVIAVIEDRNITSYTHQDLPYFENPIYTITVYNIFGNISTGNEDVTVSQEAQFKPKEIIGLKSIHSMDIDLEEPVVYIYGQESGPGIQPINIRRFNYQTNETEAISDLDPQGQTSIPIKLFNSPNGKEVVIQQGIELHFYDAITMEYKYAIDPEGVFSISDFTYYAELDLWVIADGDDVFILNRDNSNLFLVDSAAHFTEHQGSSSYKLFTLKENQLLVGHFNEPNSIVYTLDNGGNILNNQLVSIQIRFINNEKSIYNREGDYLLDTSQNRLYSTISFQSIGSFESPNFPSGTSKNGMRIFGTNNDPEWNINQESLHKKEAIVFDRNSGAFQKYETTGYPHIIFENFNGDIISLSSGLKKNMLNRSISDKADFFVEKVNQ